MVPWGCLGGPPGPPEGIPGTVRARFETQLNLKKNDAFWEAPRTSWEAPENPEGLQKSIKN